MADFTALKTAIQNAIKQNGNEEITGNLLQEVLLAIVTTLGDGSINDLVTALGSEATTRGNADTTLQQNIDAEAQARSQAVSAEAQARQQAVSAEAQARTQADTALGGRIDGVIESINAINAAIGNGYVYAGIATPSSTPTTGKVFYLALTAGTYTNFGNIAVSQGINILKYNGSAWLLDAFVGIDDAPTPSSNNLIKSGGVFNDIMTNGSAFDLSAYNNGTTYADLNAALTALNALPAAYKKGGMSLKFVLTSDNKYVQYRLMSDTFNTTVANWQGVDDAPTVGSENLVKSGGVGDFVINETAYTKTSLSVLTGWSNRVYTTSGSVSSLSGSVISQPIQVKKGDRLLLTVAMVNSIVCPIVFSAQNNLPNSATVLSEPSQNGKYVIDIENDGYVYISYSSSDTPLLTKIIMTNNQLREITDYSESHISEIELQIRYKSELSLEMAVIGYAIEQDGTLLNNSSSCIATAIKVNKGDILIFKTYNTFANRIDPLMFNSALTYDSSDYERVELTDIDENVYKYYTNKNGYVYINSDRTYFSNVYANIYRIEPQKQNTYSKKVEAVWGTAGYIGADGSSSSYRIGGVSVISPSINVLKGDIINVTINGGINSNAAPIAYHATDGEVKNNAAAGYYTPLCEYAEGVSNYSCVAPENGFIFITFDPTSTTYVTITRERTNNSGGGYWNGKKWLCIGDSLTNDNPTANLRYLDYIADITCITPINIGISGSGYKRLQDSGVSFPQQADKHYTSDIDVVTIFGSFNDLNYSAMGYSSLDEYIGNYNDTGTETIAGCINTLIATIISRNPLVKIGIIAPTPWKQTRNIPDSDNDKYVSLLKKVAEYNSVPFLNLFVESGLMPWLSSVRSAAYSKDGDSGVHPDENGQKMFAPMILSLLKKLLLNS